MLQYAQAMIIPIVLAVLISYALEPIVVGSTRVRLPRPLGRGRRAAAARRSGRHGCSTRCVRRRTPIIEQLPQAARRMRATLRERRPSQPARSSRCRRRRPNCRKPPMRRRRRHPPPPGVTRVQVEAPPFDISDYLVWGSLGARGRGRPARADSVPRLLPARLGRFVSSASW